MAGIFTRKQLSAILAEETTPEEKADAIFSLYVWALVDVYVTKAAALEDKEAAVDAAKKDVKLPPITETGEYNKSYIKKFFPEENAVALKGVGRVQGLMVKKGNPLGIKEFKDIKNVRYVNRQRGAGTRILCDYLLDKNGISPDEINGYNNEEFTHTSVAALIAAGNADAGLGIYSAAKMYDLDFIPVCNETYEFLCGTENKENPMVKAFLDVLNSDEFKARLQQMGGYSEG